MLKPLFDCFNPVLFSKGILSSPQLGHLPPSPLCSFPVPAHVVHQPCSKLGWGCPPVLCSECAWPEPVSVCIRATHLLVDALLASIKRERRASSWQVLPLVSCLLTLRSWTVSPFLPRPLEMLLWKRCSCCHSRSDFSACKMRRSGDENKNRHNLELR